VSGPIRFAVSVVAVSALLLATLLPLEHVHASSDGTVTVHRHVGAHPHHAESSSHHHPAPADQRLTADDHDDHASARTIVPAYHAQRPYVVHHPAPLAAAIVIEPDFRRDSAVQPLKSAPAHGPPIRIRSLRAPPASV